MLEYFCFAGAPLLSNGEQADTPMFISPEEFIGTRSVAVREEYLVALLRVADAVSRFDCSPLTRLLYAKGFCDDLSCTRPLVLHFLRLLAVIAIHHDTLIPPYVCSKVLDKVWSTVLMFPTLYTSICSLFVSSGVIHFSPFSRRSHGGEISAYNHIKSKYLVTFGRQPGALFWPDEVSISSRRIFGDYPKPLRVEVSQISKLPDNPLTYLTMSSF